MILLLTVKCHCPMTRARSRTRTPKTIKRVHQEKRLRRISKILHLPTMILGLLQPQSSKWVPQLVSTGHQTPRTEAERAILRVALSFKTRNIITFRDQWGHPINSTSMDLNIPNSSIMEFQGRVSQPITMLPHLDTHMLSRNTCKEVKWWQWCNTHKELVPSNLSNFSNNTQATLIKWWTCREHTQSSIWRICRVAVDCRRISPLDQKTSSIKSSTKSWEKSFLANLGARSCFIFILWVSNAQIPKTANNHRSTKWWLHMFTTQVLAIPLKSWVW